MLIFFTWVSILCLAWILFSIFCTKQIQAYHDWKDAIATKIQKRLQEWEDARAAKKAAKAKLNYGKENKLFPFEDIQTALDDIPK